MYVCICINIYIPKYNLFSLYDVTWMPFRTDSQSLCAVLFLQRNNKHTHSLLLSIPQPWCSTRDTFLSLCKILSFTIPCQAAIIFSPLSSLWPLKFVDAEKRFFQRTTWILSLSTLQLLPFPSCADDWISVVLEHCSSANPSLCSSVLWKLISARSLYQHLWLRVLGRARLGLPSDLRDPFYPKPLTSSPLFFLSCTVICL